MPPASGVQMGKNSRVKKASKPKQLFRDLDPLEQGGRTARAGFEYQDHVAAAKCLDMLLGGGPIEVWCESEDDIVLVWDTGTEEWFECVQVKSNDLGQAWTVAELCKKEAAKGGKGSGRCIVEKSLAHDRSDDICRFRIVTCWKPDVVLGILALELDNESRVSNGAKVTAAATAIKKKIGAAKSPNGRDVSFWASMTVWEVQATIDDVRNSNLLKLERVLTSVGLFLAPDQRVELYDRLFRRVQDASLADGVTQKAAKRLVRADLLTWLRGQADAILHPVQAGTSATLEAKLVTAGADGTAIEVAKDQRRRYLHEVRQPRYLAVQDREDVESEALARLHRLKTRLDAEELNDSGLQFLSRCQQALLDLRDSINGQSKPPEGILYGYLYDVMNRCLHRLMRAST